MQIKTTKAKPCNLLLQMAALAALLCAVPAANADIYVANNGSDTIGDYSVSGATVNGALVGALSYPYGIAVSGTDMFVVNNLNGIIGAYTTAGATINASLATAYYKYALGIAVDGTNMFVASSNYGSGESRYDWNRGESTRNPSEWVREPTRR